MTVPNFESGDNNGEPLP